MLVQPTYLFEFVVNLEQLLQGSLVIFIVGRLRKPLHEGSSKPVQRSASILFLAGLSTWIPKVYLQVLQRGLIRLNLFA